MKSINHTVTHLGLAALVLIGITSGVSAHKGATGIVADRMNAMKSVAASMKSIKASLDNGTQTSRDTIITDAQNIAEHASRTDQLYPEGSLDHPTEATALIWDEWERFLEMSADMESRAVTLATSAQANADASVLQDQFRALGATCKACHERYRIKR